MTVDLKHLDVGLLTGSAGGDPWQVNRTMQSGSPGQISELATAFYSAAACTTETNEFAVAQQRFAAAWDRQDGGGHPINDSAEVKRATESLKLNDEQIRRIAVDLQNVSASLAEAQRSGDVVVSNLDASLKWIDNLIEHELAVAAANGEQADVEGLRQAAVDRTREALESVQAVRDGYSEQLTKSRQEMATEGYSPDAVKHVEVQQDSLTDEAKAEADRYGSGQRERDEALVNSPAAWTPEKQAAAARLRDFSIINDPTARLEQVQYAGQRLADYHTSITHGPLPTDPVLGGDARSRARTRLEMQAMLEQGLVGEPPMSPDRATAMINQTEALTRELVIARVQDQLTRVGMSPEGAAAATDSMAQGVVPKELVEAASAANKPIAGGAKAFDYFADSLPLKDHPVQGMPGFSPSDVDVLKKVGGNLGVAGNLVDFGVGMYEWRNGAPLAEVAAKTGGGMVGASGMAAIGAWLGAPAGPVGVFAGAFILGSIGSLAGEQIGEGIYQKVTGS
ncbi:putative alpha/beta hydrolase [Mycolicibacterium sp. XJ1904]